LDYTTYYGMQRVPFSNRPAAHRFFRSQIHSAAWRFLMAAWEAQEAYVLITGAHGTGKTLLSLKLAEKLDEAGSPYIHVSTAMEAQRALLRRIIDTLQLGDVDHAEDAESLRERIMRHFESGATDTVVIIVDEADDYSDDTLLDLRRLADFNHQGHYPIRLFFFGTDRFTQRLASRPLAALNERIKRRYKLMGLDWEETKQYIYFHLLDSGADGSPYFSDEAIDHVVRRTEGNPRRINSICDMALSIGASRRFDEITSEVMAAAAHYLSWDESSAEPPNGISIPAATPESSERARAYPRPRGDAAPERQASPAAESQSGSRHAPDRGNGPSRQSGRPGNADDAPPRQQAHPGTVRPAGHVLGSARNSHHGRPSRTNDGHTSSHAGSRQPQQSPDESPGGPLATWLWRGAVIVLLVVIVIIFLSRGLSVEGVL
jgi:type II secretory pathway predicted ATPase ExeA